MNKMINKTILLLEKIYNPLFNMLIIIFAARIFGMKEVGEIAIIMISSLVGQYVVTRGVDQNLQVEIASENEMSEEIILHETKRRIKITLILLLIIIVFIQLEVEVNISTLIGIIIGGIYSISIPYDLGKYIAQEYKDIVVRKYTSGIMSFIVSAILLYIFGIKELVYVFLLERVIYLIQTILRNKKNLFGKGAKKNKIDIPVLNLHVIISTLCVFIFNRYDQIYVQSNISQSELGVYYTLLKLFEIINLVVFTGITSKLKFIANRNIDSKYRINEEKHLLKMTLILCVFLVFVAENLVKLIFNINIQNSGFIYILGISTFANCIGSIKGPWVAVNNLFKNNMLFTVIGAVFSLICLTYLRPETLFNVILITAISQIIVNIICPLFIEIERKYLLHILGWK